LKDKEMKKKLELHKKASDQAIFAAATKYNILK